MRAILLTLVTLVLGQGGGVFEVGVWPGEGRPRFIAGTTTLLPRAQPQKDAPTTSPVQVKKGGRVEFGETLYRTTVPGRLTALVDSQIAGRRLGSIVRLSKDDYYSGRYPQASLAVRAGETVDYLQYRAEGTCFVRLRGEVMDAKPCPDQQAESFLLESKPQTEWWIEMIVNGRPKGWLLVDGTKLRVAGRTF